MKKTIAIALLLSAMCARSQDTVDPQPVPLTNGPVILKGIFGARSPGQRPSTSRGLPPVIAQSVVRKLKEIQNPDGSWGAQGTQQLATAFALISFMREGESRGSQSYGKTVQAAHGWLIESEPKTDAERVATAIALSDYMTLHYRWHYRSGSNRQAIPDQEMQKLKHCVETISPQCGEMWADLLRVSRMPQELGQVLDRSAAFALWRKYAEREPSVSPSKLDDYLLLTLCSQATFHLGGKHWTDFNHRFMPALTQQYQSDGLFACDPTSDRLPATGLAVIACTVYYQTSFRFSPPIRQPKESDEDEEIVIEL